MGTFQITSCGLLHCWTMTGRVERSWHSELVQVIKFPYALAYGMQQVAKGCTVLHHAVSADAKGCTVLQHVMSARSLFATGYGGYINFIQLLLKARANIIIPDDLRRLPIELAALLRECKEKVELLLPLTSPIPNVTLVCRPGCMNAHHLEKFSKRKQADVYTHSDILKPSANSRVVDMLLCKGPAPFPHKSVHENCRHKGRQPVENESFATSTLMRPFLETNGSAQIFCINTFQNEASEAMFKCEDCFETRNRWLELLGAGVVVNGSVRTAGEQLWPDNSFIQDQNRSSTHGAVFWADIRAEEQLRITNLPLQEDIRRHIRSVHRLEGKPHFKRRGMSGTGPMDHGLPAGPLDGLSKCFRWNKSKTIKD